MAKTKKQKLALEVIERLREEYPDADERFVHQSDGVKTGR